MDNILIKADVDHVDVHVCKFTVDRPVHGGADTYESKEAAQTDPLAAKVFAIPGVSRVELSDNIVTVKKDDNDDWRQVGRRVGTAIRNFINPPPELPEGDRLPPQEVRERIQRVLDTQINPGVAAHGGFVELIDVQDDTIYIRMGGGCQGCGAADVTLKMGVERLIREEVPQVREILDTTDHAGGSNPYYAPSK
jgi:Fe-S cluster biogenesis protein NfuA